MLKLYMDTCALKRPFDDLEQGRIYIESQAVIRILCGVELRVIRVFNSEALVYENRNNPNPVRRERVAQILRRFGEPAIATDVIFRRAEFLVKKAGISDLDALHLAFACHLAVDYFITCDDNLIHCVRKLDFNVIVMNPLLFVKENNL